jgi:ATPase family associated with various cellular activities (AAA)
MSDQTANSGTVSNALAPGSVEMGVRALQSLLNDTSDASPVIHRDGAILYTSPVIWANRLRTVVIGLSDDSPGSRAALAAVVLDRSREALCLCVLPTAESRVWPVAQSSQSTAAAAAFPFYRDDLDALGCGRLELRDLLEYKMYRRFVLDKPDIALRFHERSFTEYSQPQETPANRGFQLLDNVLRDLAEDPNEWVSHPYVHRITRALEQGRGALLVGISSAGKSVLSFQTGRDRLLAGARVLYLNLGTVATEPVHALSTFLGVAPSPPPDLVIIDDLQSNPGLARCLLALSNLFRRASSGSTVAVLGTSWPDFAVEASTWHEQCLPVSVQPSIIRDAIVKQYGRGLSEEILSVVAAKFGDDLVLLRLALQQASRVGARPLLISVAEELWKQRTDKSAVEEAGARRIALVAGSLGRYDISSPQRFLSHEARVHDDDLQRLVMTKLLRRNGAYLSMGHRSLCALMCDWLASQDAWRLLADDGGPSDARTVVLDYLKSLGAGLTVDSLRSLHARAGLKDRPQLNRRAIAVVEIWRAFDAIVERVERQQERDATWNAVPSSAMFAVQVLGEVGKPELAQSSLRFLRDHWSIDRNGHLAVSIDGLTTHSDFEGIRSAMLAEDEQVSPLDARWSAAGEVDFDRFHQTWLGGLVLCAEAAGHQPVIDLVTLAAAAEQLQCDGGGFYPERVPWCTARVLLGLAACDRNIHTSRAVERAVTWLLRPHTEGGALRDGLWVSGTGNWNTTLETTGMVLLALAAVGFDMSDKRLLHARGFLMSEKPRWTAAGSELAGALAIQAYLETGGSWEDVVQEAQRLSQWAKGTAFWEGATATAKVQLEQTCMVAQIAWHLTAIGWVAIKSDLAAFLDALSTPHQYRDDLAPVLVPADANPSPAPSESPDSSVATSTTLTDHVLTTLLELGALSIMSSIVVGQYMRDDERVRNRLKDWCARISRPLTTSPTKIHENFLIWAAPGSGKSFLIQQLATSLSSSIAYIELNLAAMTRADFNAGLRSVAASNAPTLCLLDEIDSRGDEDWPYEDVLPLLDLNRSGDRPVVFVLVGSRGDGREGMIARMKERPNGTERPKGKDLIDRVPGDRRFEIPPTTLKDKGIIVAAHVTEAARLRGARVREIEKMLLYYVLSNQDLTSPRQLSDLARDAVQRMSIKDDRLRYDNLFEDGDTRNQRFFAAHLDAANQLSGVFVRINEERDAI